MEHSTRQKQQQILRLSMILVIAVFVNHEVVKKGNNRKKKGFPNKDREIAS